jgi:DNA-directed RNA polymerase subunit omega
MARVTVEDCLARIRNRFALTILGSRRARALSEDPGRVPLVDCDNKEGVTALREIGRGVVRYRESVEQTMAEFIDEQRRQLRSAQGDQMFLEAASLRAMEEEELEVDEEDDEIEEVPTDPERLAADASNSTDDEEDAEGNDDEPADDATFEADFSEEENLNDSASDDEETSEEDDE